MLGIMELNGHVGRHPERMLARSKVTCIYTLAQEIASEFGVKRCFAITADDAGNPDKNLGTGI
jgi:hypothetical protein